MDIKTLEAFSLSDAVKFHDELNPKLWRDNQLRPDVKKQLLVIAQDFMQELGLDDLKVEDITISGSNAAYTYTDHSDLDLHILVDFSKLPNNEVYQELFNAKKTLYNDNHDITVHGVPIELYVQDTNQVHHSLGEYSLKNNTWTRIPKKRKADLDQSATKLKYDKLYDLIHLALKSKNIEKINELLSTIKRYRQAGLDQGGEFSPENLAFKALRSQGLINKLYALKNKLHSDELTIEDYDPNGPPPGPEFKPTMPQGTVRVDVSDVYDWYKLGQHISNLKGLGKHDFGKGPPSTIMAFGSEPEEHKYIKDLEKTGLTTTDIDPVDPKQPKGMKRQKVDPTYNVNESSFNKCFDKACEVYDKALKKNLKPVMYQVADYVGNAENADSKWQKLPMHIWSHYVTVVNDIVLDPTAKQFGDDKPIKYSFDELQNNWKKIFKIRPKEIDEAGYKGNLGISELTRLFIQHPELKPKFLEIKQKHGIEKAFMWAAEQLGVKLQPILSKKQGVAEGKMIEKNIIDILNKKFKNINEKINYIVKQDIDWIHKLELIESLSSNDSIKENASGYIPSKKQANDPRFKTALTVDVKPDTIKKNAKAFGFKVSRAGIPPLLREDIHSSEDLKDVASWMNTTPDKLKITLKQEPIEKFIKQIREMYGTFDENPEDEERTNRILKLLKRGAEPLPIYVEADDKDLFVMEGRHRMVAFWLNKMKTIPVAYVSVKEKVSEQKNVDKITAYHGTRRDIDKFKPFSHFGTFRAAYDRLDHTRRGDKNEIDNEQIYQVELDINNPIELDVDIFDNHKLSDYVELLQRKKVLDDSEVESIKSPSDLLKTLLGKGYDGIKYKNRWEHPGSISYVIFKPDQVRVSDIITHNQPNKFNRLLTKN